MHSIHSGPIEINLINGRKTVDTQISNYSYGALQEVLKSGLKEAGIDDSVKQILVLGLGGGSVVETIRNDFHSSAYLTLVDIDPVMIQIASEEYKIHSFGNLQLIESDAFSFMLKNKEEYDIIIVDLFIGNAVPEAFTQENFIAILNDNISSHGKIIFNTMRESISPEHFNRICAAFRQLNFNLTILKKVQGYNDLIIARKLTT